MENDKLILGGHEFNSRFICFINENSIIFVGTKIHIMFYKCK